MAKIGYGGIRITDETDDLLRQYFWWNPSQIEGEIEGQEYTIDAGAYILNKPVEEFKKNPIIGGGNLLSQSNGIRVRDGLTDLATFTQNGVTIEQPDGTFEITASGLRKTFLDNPYLILEQKYTAETAISILNVTLKNDQTVSADRLSLKMKEEVYITSDETITNAFLFDFDEYGIYKDAGSQIIFSAKGVVRTYGTPMFDYEDIKLTLTIGEDEAGTKFFINEVGGTNESIVGYYDGIGQILFVDSGIASTTLMYSIVESCEWQETTPSVGGNFTIGKRDDAWAGKNSLVIGTGTAQKNYSMVIGEGLNSKHPNQLVIGRFNDTDLTGDAVFVIGGGTGENYKTNVLKIDRSGRIIKNITGISQMNQRDEACIVVNGRGEDNAAYPGVDFLTPNGDWGLSTVKNQFRLSYVTNTDYITQDNTINAYFGIDPGQSILVKHSKSYYNIYITPGTFRINDGSGNLDIGHTYTTSTVASILTANTTNASINAAEFAQWGKLAQLSVVFVTKKNITVTSGGGIAGDPLFGTLVSGKRPAIVAYGGSASDVHPCWQINKSGTITLLSADARGSSYTVAAGAELRIRATYILA